MPAHPQKINKLLVSTTLSALQAESRRHDAMLAAVKASLPPSLAMHCKHCILKPDHLIIYASSPLYATQIRFHAQGMLREIQRFTGEKIMDVKVRNFMETTTPPGPKQFPIPAHLSPETLRHIQQTATGFSEDELGDALKRLSVSLQKRLSQS